MNSIKLSKDHVWYMFLFFALISLIFSANNEILAAETGEDIIGVQLCRVVNMLTGTVAKAVGTIAIFVVGVSLFLGRINWGTAAATAVGIGIIFGAGQLVDFLAGEDGGNCVDIVEASESS